MRKYDIASMRAYRFKNRQRINENATMSRYDISREEVRRLRALPCGLCGTTSGKIEIDHDHVCQNCGFMNLNEMTRGTRASCRKCGTKLRIRGVLCRKHNFLVGALELGGVSIEKILKWIHGVSK